MTPMLGFTICPGFSRCHTHNGPLGFLCGVVPSYCDRKDEFTYIQSLINKYNPHMTL